jgi:hypothetical protein
VRRLDRRGGRGQGVLVRIHRPKLEALRKELARATKTAGGLARRIAHWLASRPTWEPSETLQSPLHPSKKIKSASSGLRQSGPLRGLKESKSPPTLAKLKAEWARASRSPDAASRTRGAIGCFRKAAWLRGKPFELSVKLAQASALEAWQIRTASRRDPWLRAVMARVLMDHANMPVGFAAMRLWVRSAEQWSELQKTCCPVDALGRVAGRRAPTKPPNGPSLTQSQQTETHSKLSKQQAQQGFAFIYASIGSRRRNRAVCTSS